VTQFLDLTDFLLIAEAVTGVRAELLARTSRIDLAESALAAPQASFGGVDFYPDFVDQAAVLCAHLAWNHSLHDGNKRVAWLALREFCRRNGHDVQRTVDDAVTVMLAVATHDIDEAGLAAWIRPRLVEIGA
jgi:death-on-curing protein